MPDIQKAICALDAAALAVNGRLLRVEVGENAFDSLVESMRGPPVRRYNERDAFGDMTPVVVIAGPGGYIEVAMVERTPRRGRRQPNPANQALQREVRATDVQQSEDRAAVAQLQGVTLGAIVLFAAAVDPPARYWRCDGQEVGRSQLAELFGVISDFYGTGDGSTTFNLPDLTASEPADTDYWIWAGVAR